MRRFKATGGQVPLLRQDPPPQACDYVFYSDNAGALRVPHRGSDNARRYARRLDRIATLASALVDADNGRPVVSAVTHPAYEHAGVRAASLPHLLLHYCNNICPRAVASPKLGCIEAPVPANIRSGNHEAGGFAFAAGPAVGAAVAKVRHVEDFGSLAAKVLRVGS